MVGLRYLGLFTSRILFLEITSPWSVFESGRFPSICEIFKNLSICRMTQWFRIIDAVRRHGHQIIGKFFYINYHCKKILKRKVTSHT